MVELTKKKLCIGGRHSARLFEIQTANNLPIELVNDLSCMPIVLVEAVKQIHNELTRYCFDQVNLQEFNDIIADDDGEEDLDS